MEQQRPQRPTDATSQLLLDIAAGRSIGPDRLVTEPELELASRHGLLGIMAVSDHPRIAEAARAPFARLAARQQVMEKVLKRLLNELSEAGIRATVVKGPALAHWAYSDFRHRTFTDLDLLVPRDQVADAIELLRSDEATLTIPPKTPRADKRNVPLADRSGVRFNLDLHWDLFSYTQLRGCAVGAVDAGWEQAVWVPDHELGPMWSLPEEVVVAFLATHAVLDHRFRLILFRDLVEVARTGVEWERLIDFTGRYRLRSTSYAAWHIASITLSAAVPRETLRALRPRSLPVVAMERLLPRTDLVHFDGHRPHLLNLATVLLHDLPSSRLRLMVSAPFAFPEWLRRVEGGTDAARTRPRVRPRAAPVGVSRVLHVLPVDVARGAQNYARAIRNSLDGIEVEHRTATIFRSEAVMLDADFALGVTRGIGRRLGFSLSAMLQLRKHIKQWKPDIVVAHGGEALKYAAFGPKSARLAYYKIGTAQELLRNPIRRGFHRILVRRAELVVGVSNEMVEEARTLLGVRPDRMAYIPNGRDPTLFPAPAVESSHLPVRFVSIGYFNRFKRPEQFVALVAALRSRGVDAVGWMVGEGPMLDSIKRSRPPGIEFLGRRDDVPSLLSGCDVFVLTSIAEGMPGVLIEAGLAGLPSVTTDVSGARDVVVDGVTGFVVAVHDRAALIDAAERLARDPALRDAMGRAARARCLDNFTLDSSIDLWRQQLARLLAGVGR